MAEESENSRWQRISGRLLGLSSNPDGSHRTNLNFILDELNSVDYNSGIVVSSREEALAVLTKGCSLVPGDGSNSSLSSKFCQLIINTCSRQKVELNQKCLDELLEFLMKAIQKCQKWSVIDHLRAMGAVLYEAGPMCGKFARDLLGNSTKSILAKYCQASTSDPEVQCSAIHCVGNICMRSPSGFTVDDEFVTIALQVLLPLLLHPPDPDRNEFQHLRIINTALKALQNIVESVQSGYKALLPSLLAALKNYMFYGMPGFKPCFTENKKNGEPDVAGIEPDDISSINLQPMSIKQASYLNPQTKKKKKRTGNKKGKKEKQPIPGSQGVKYTSSKYSSVDTLTPSYLRADKRRPQYAAQERPSVDALTPGFARAGSSGKGHPVTAQHSSVNALTPSFARVQLRADAKEFSPRKIVDRGNNLDSVTIASEHIVGMKSEQRAKPGLNINGDVLQTKGEYSGTSVESLSDGKCSSSHMETRVEKQKSPADLLPDKHQRDPDFNHELNQKISRSDKISESGTLLSHKSDSIAGDNRTCDRNCHAETIHSDNQGREANTGVSLDKSNGSVKWSTGRGGVGEDQNKDSGHSSDSEGFSSTASSDSEYSDSDAGHALRRRSMSSKVRQAALLCLQKFVKAADRKLMFGYWSSFIPDSTTGLQWSLFTTILKDSAPKARASGVGVLAELLEGSRQFLLAAEDREETLAGGRARPFTSFSAKLAGIVRELHRCLLQALVAESFIYTKIQILKCIAVLVANTPYNRLNRGLLTKLVKQLRPLLTHKDCCVCVAAMECLAMVVSVHTPLDEVAELMKPAMESTAVIGDTQTSNNPSSGQTPSQPLVSPSVFTDELQGELPASTPWLVTWCYQAVCQQNDTTTQPIAIRIQALQVLATFVKHYFTLASSSAPWLANLSCSCSQEEDQALALYGIKLLDELGKAMLGNILKQSPEDVSTVVTKQQLKNFWMKLLEGPLTKMLQNDGSHVSKLCSAAIDCLTGIGASIFEILPQRKQIVCVTLVLGLCSDEDKLVQASAVRALGVFVLYPCLKEDVLFVADAANAVLTSMADTSLPVRTRAAWSLANLSDSLVVNRSVENSTFVEDFSDMLLLKLLDISITASADNEKVKSNAVRAIGNFLRYLKPSSLDKRGFADCVERGVLALARTVGTGLMKVRWNACYALGNVFRNSALPLGTASWTTDAYSALLEVISDCKNFKVRYNAGLALSIPSQRSCYGDTKMFLSIWETHVKALIATDTITEFAEFRYRDNLREQLCTTLCHLATVVEEDDVTPLASLLEANKNTLKRFITQYYELLSPQESADNTGFPDAGSSEKSEKLSQILQARKHIAEELSMDLLGSDCLLYVFALEYS